MLNSIKGKLLLVQEKLSQGQLDSVVDPEDVPPLIQDHPIIQVTYPRSKITLIQEASSGLWNHRGREGKRLQDLKPSPVALDLIFL